MIIQCDYNSSMISGSPMSIFEETYILFKDIYIYMLVTMESREGIRCSGAGILGSGEPSYVEYGNQTWVFSRDSKLS